MLRRITLLLCLVTLIASLATAQMTLNGAGATFPYPIYSKWFSEYHNIHPEVAPRVDHECAGKERVLDIELHLSIDPAPVEEP